MPSHARPVLRGTTYLVTKRCAFRWFLLTPTPFVTQVMLYCLAVAANRFGVAVHAACVMSNHVHLVLTDYKGWLPKFMHWFNLQSSKCLNAHYGRAGPLWEDRPYSRVTLNGEVETEDVIDPLSCDDDILDKMVYVLTNPVSAGLVPCGEDWPGLRTGFLEGGREEISVERPKLYFKSPPPKAVLSVVRPPCYQDLSDEEFSELLEARVLEREQQARSQFEDDARDFEGAERVVTQDIYEKPATEEPVGGANPRVAGRDRWRREERFRRDEVWLLDYVFALREFPADPTVEFPAGTYELGEQLGVRVAEQRPNSAGLWRPPDG
ncbi:MAG: transposase [Planctomycetota bacterium]